MPDHGKDIPLEPNVVLLYYKEYEADKFVPMDRYLKRFLRPYYEKLHTKQKISGFQMSFRLLCQSLRKIGMDVRVNDYKTALQNPTYPVGLVGFPILLDTWKFPNPALLGPSLYDHPLLAPNLFDNKSNKKLLVLADWQREMFSAHYGPDRCRPWFAGIDVEKWEDASCSLKTNDFLIYDKIRWDRNIMEERFLKRIIQKLTEQGYTYRKIRYKFHDHATFQNLLRSSKYFLFLCEHETQGIAYQEALTTNLPVLAWNPGFWADPLWKIYSSKPVPASSVPFFSPDCGRTFTNLGDFDDALVDFIGNVGTFQPRKYIEANLSQSRSAELYVNEYFSLNGK